MVEKDPKKGEGWNFLDDESDAWYEAFETLEDENGEIHVDVDHYDEFEDIYDLVNFVAGTGSYQDTRQFTPGQEDLEMKKREMKNDVWKIPSKIEEINEYLESGAMRGEIDIDPNAKAAWNITETEAHLDDSDTKYTAHFLAYNPEKSGDIEQENDYFHFQVSWYDTPPEETNLEDLFKSIFPEEKEEE